MLCKQQSLVYFRANLAFTIKNEEALLKVAKRPEEDNNSGGARFWNSKCDFYSFTELNGFLFDLLLLQLSLLQLSSFYYMKSNWIYIFLFALLTTAWACESDGEGTEKNDSHLPKASPVPNEILVVMDSAKWEGALGDELRQTFGAAIPGLPQEEASFIIRYVSPRHFKGFMKNYPNIVFVTTLDDRSKDSRVMRSYFTENSLQQIRENPDMFMLARKNEYARGQEVLHLFAKTEEELLQKIEENKRSLYSYFAESERNRLSRRLFTGLPNKKVSNYVEKQHGFRMEFPLGYDVAASADNFIWVRKLDQEEDISIWVGYQEYNNENVFQEENILELRKQIASQFIFGKDSSTYMKTERDVPVHTREVNFKGNYAVETRGLWRLHNMIMGGPFLSYTFVDEDTNRLYYIEGFAYAPGEKKRGAIREIEAILHTFKTTKKEQAASVKGSTATQAAVK